MTDELIGPLPDWYNTLMLAERWHVHPSTLLTERPVATKWEMNACWVWWISMHDGARAEADDRLKKLGVI